MKNIDTSFGYFPRDIEVKVGDISIRALSDLKETVEEIESDEDLDKGWVYPGPQLVSNLGVGIFAKPFSARLFSLPHTHRFEHSSVKSDYHVDFILWCLGFTLGMHFSRHPNCYLDAAPIKPGKFSDFLLPMSQLPYAITEIENFWKTNEGQPRMAKRVCAVINSLNLSRRPQHLDYEEFNLLYMALDTCFAISRDLFRLPPKNRVPHGVRIEWMCEQFGLAAPTWAIPGHKDSLAGIRNDTVHEALFFGEPLGYAHFDNNTMGKQYRNIMLEMNGLINRLLVCILFGTTSSYVKTSLGTRQRYRLEID